MYTKIILALVFAISISCVAEEPSAERIEELIAEGILDDLEDDNEENGDVRSAIRYIIPVPIRVVVPVPRQSAPPPAAQEREPIVAVPITLTPGPYPTWRPAGPPVIAVPIGSASPQYPYDDDDYERRALSGELKKPPKAGNRPQAGFRPQNPHASPRRTRSISEKDTKVKNEDVFRRDLRLGPVQDTVAAKGIHGVDFPQKVSAKSWRKGFRGGMKASGHIRRKRQYYGNANYYPRGRYNHPSQIMVPNDHAPVFVPVPVQPPVQQVVPVPVYVPVAVNV